MNSTVPYLGFSTIVIGAAGAGEDCGITTTVGVVGVTKITFFGSSTGGGVGKEGVEGVGDAVGDGELVGVGVGELVGAGVELVEGEGVGVGVTNDFGTGKPGC